MCVSKREEGGGGGGESGGKGEREEGAGRAEGGAGPGGRVEEGPARRGAGLAVGSRAPELGGDAAAGPLGRLGSHTGLSIFLVLMSPLPVLLN